MKPALFIDTSYFLALVNSRDKYHESAKEIATQIKPPFITSQAVLFELGNALAKPLHRDLGIRVLQQIQLDVSIEIVQINQELFEQSIALYHSHPDKSWGLTDCSSFVIMKERGCLEALTTDKHFEQAGFKRLLHLI